MKESELLTVLASDSSSLVWCAGAGAGAGDGAQKKGSRRQASKDPAQRGPTIDPLQLTQNSRWGKSHQLSQIIIQTENLLFIYFSYFDLFLSPWPDIQVKKWLSAEPNFLDNLVSF